MDLKSIPKNKRRLSLHTTVKIGGEAKDFFYITNLEELLFVFHKYGKDFYLIGNGSNLLVTDDELSRPVVKFADELCGFSIEDGNILNACGGAMFSQVLKHCLGAQLGGLEGLVGIPGTIGGMLAINAGAFKHTISDFLIEAEVFDLKKKRKVLPKSKLDFGYRDSSLKGQIILGAKFQLKEDKFVQERARDFLRERVARQDYEHPSFGSVFKNPPGFSAGQLIDSCGLKGMKHDGAQISPRHANFIINIGNAKCSDVEYLIQAARIAVKKKYNINLEQEVVKWI